MFDSPLLAAVMGLGVGGIGIGIGGLVAYGFGRYCEKVMGILLACLAGVIFALLGLELLPESIAAGGLTSTGFGIFLGILLILRVEHLFHKVVIITDNPRRSLFIRSGILLAFGVAIHNFPVGFAMGSGLINEEKIGMDLAITMLLHNFPEGFAISLPLVLGGLSWMVIPVTAGIVAIPAGLGSFIGSSLGMINPKLLGLLFGVAIGTIFLVTWYEILGHAINHTRRILLFPSIIAGLLVGILFIHLVM
ncbi:MAG: ZIP family metal transporter [Desulfitobacterium hafniense]|nr:ZIP family metal transporter [Desulfitobacterium hafniense]